MLIYVVRCCRFIANQSGMWWWNSQKHKTRKSFNWHISQKTKQFTYCPLIWMFCAKQSLCRIKDIHELYQHLIQQNYISEFNRLNFFWLRFINTWMACLLILWALSLSSDKICITSDISMHLNIEFSEQESLFSEKCF